MMPQFVLLCVPGVEEVHRFSPEFFGEENSEIAKPTPKSNQYSYYSRGQRHLLVNLLHWTMIQTHLCNNNMCWSL